MNTGEKIKRLRKERKMTQEDLGFAIGVQKAAINKYETGAVVNFKKETIAKLARALSVSPVWLMDDEADWPPPPNPSEQFAAAYRPPVPIHYDEQTFNIGSNLLKMGSSETNLTPEQTKILQALAALSKVDIDASVELFLALLKQGVL